MQQVHSRMMPTQHAAVLIASALALAAVGCSPDSGLSAVTGKVTYGGQPVSGATVVFLGEESARPATAITGSDGEYSLRTLDANGAAPGAYTVVVTKSETPVETGEPPSMEEAAKRANRPPPPPKRLLPAKYGDAASSPLKVEVRPGQANVLNLELAD